MKNLINNLNLTLKYYRSLYDSIDKSEFPEGTLSIYKKYGTYQYYQVINNQRIYIKKEENLLANRLAQKSYIQKIDKYLAKIISLLEKTTKLLEIDIDDFYENLRDERKELVKPIVNLKSVMIKEWRESYPTIELKNIDSYLLSSKGVLVRSYSEKYISDELEKNHIEYVYEKPLLLNGYGYIHPTFTFYNPEIRKEIYWEHIDLSKNINNYNNFIKKMNAYNKNKIFLGERLIISFADEDSVGVDLKSIELLIKNYLK